MMIMVVAVAVVVVVVVVGGMAMPWPWQIFARSTASPPANSSQPVHPQSVCSILSLTRQAACNAVEAA